MADSPLARMLADIQRRLKAVERAAQLGNASVDIDGVSVRVTDGIASGLAAEYAAAQALDLASSADAKADGKIQTFYSADPPTAGDVGVGDFWVDSVGHASSWDGSAWQPVTSQAVTDALTAAQNAEAGLDGKVTTFYTRLVTDPAPVAEAIGDIWINGAASNQMKRWDGTAWVLLQAGTDAISDSAITSPKVASINADRIATSSLTATLLLSGIIRTAASGARVELTSTGLKAYSATSGTTPTISILSTGTGTFTGTITSTLFRATGTGDVTLTSTGHAVQVGASNNYNIAMDNNEIQARNNGAYSGLILNGNGGDVNLGSTTAGGINYLKSRTIVTTGSSSDVSMAANSGIFQIGSTDQEHMVMDANEIQAKQPGGTVQNSININLEGGNVHLGGYGAPGTVYSDAVTILNDNSNTSTFQINTDFDNNFGFSQIRTYANEEANLIGWNVLASTVANNNTPSTVYRLRADGTGLCDKAWTGGGADFAEMFESSDGKAIPMGRAVTLDKDGKVRLAKKGELIIGVTSANPTVVGNVPLNWPDQFQKDVYGTHLTDADGKRIVNPAWTPPPADLQDDEDHYVTRDKRPEWNTIGLIGQVVVDDDGSCTAGGFASVKGNDGSFSASNNGGFLVITRVDATHVRVLVTPASTASASTTAPGAIK